MVIMHRNAPLARHSCLHVSHITLLCCWAGMSSFSCSALKAQLQIPLLSKFFSDLQFFWTFTALAIDSNVTLYYNLQWIASRYLAGQKAQALKWSRDHGLYCDFMFHTSCMSTFTLTHTNMCWLIHFIAIRFTCGKAIWSTVTIPSCVGKAKGGTNLLQYLNHSGKGPLVPPGGAIAGGQPGERGQLPNSS